MARAEPAAWQRDRACRLYDWEGAGGVACAGESDMAAGDGCHGPDSGQSAAYGGLASKLGDGFPERRKYHNDITTGFRKGTG